MLSPEFESIDSLINKHKGKKPRAAKATIDKFSKFVQQEYSRVVELDPNYHVDPDGDHAHMYAIPRNYFARLNQPYSFYEPDIKYTFDFLVFAYKEAFLLSRELRHSGTCEYVFKFKNNNIIITIRYDTHSFEQHFVSVLFYYALDESSTFHPFLNFEHIPKKSTRLGVFKKEYSEIVIHNLLLDTEKTYNKFQYNTDFEVVLDDLTNELDKEQSGIILLYGEPGTGKSSIIRHLTSLIDRQFIYVPTHMVDFVFSIDAIDMFLDRYKGAVLIIEDAEKVLMKRESEDGYSNSHTMSAILNMTDGLYADITKLTIIATYNCDRNKIDPAILRKGRLKAEYKFDRLTVAAAQKLVDFLGLEYKVTESMTLADVYNINSKIKTIQNNDERVIGFNQT